MNKFVAGLIIFFAGACTMIIEIAGSRMLGPYFGTSVFVWSSLIGVIMAGLSLGYRIGGVISVSRSDMMVLGRIILLSGIFIFALVAGHDYLLRRVIKYVPDFRLQTLTGTLLLFGPAGVMLGMILPYGAKLAMTNILTSGNTTGTVYAMSTAGSIIGTFVSGYFLLPGFGFSNILFAGSLFLILVACSLFIFFRRRISVLVCIPAIAAVSLFWVRTATKSLDYVDLDTQYNRVIVYNSTDTSTGRPVKILKVNDEKSSAMFTDSDNDLVFEVLKYYRLVEHFKPGFTKTLMIGGSGYAFPKDYLRRYPGASIDVIEIDPGLTRIAKQHFNLTDNPRLRIYHEDGRTFLNRCTTRYDAVFMDAYKSMLTIPYQLTTIEAVKRISEVLNDDGIVFANIISTLDSKSSLFLKAEMATYKRVFPTVMLFAVQHPEADPADETVFQNFILVGLKSRDQKPMTSDNPELGKYLSHLYKGVLKEDVDMLTDECAPVEFYAAKALR
jgi:spermidine synthase